MNFPISKELILKLLRYGITAILSLILLVLVYFFLCTPLSHDSKDVDRQIASIEHEQKVEALRDDLAAKEDMIAREREEYARDRDLLLREIEQLQDRRESGDDDVDHVEAPEVIVTGANSRGSTIVTYNGDTLLLPGAQKIDVSRYPTMEMPDAVIDNSGFSVLISLTEQLITSETVVEDGTVTESGELNLVLPESDSWDLDVVLSAPAFIFKDGVNVRRIILPRQGNSTIARFDLRAKPSTQHRRTSKIYATLWHEGLYLAKIAREIIITSDSLSVAVDASDSTGSIRTVEGSENELHLNGINLCSNYQVPDMTVYVLENLDATQPQLTSIILNSPFLQPYSGSFYKSPQFSSWLSSKYKMLAEKSARNLRPVGADPNASVRNKEQTLYFLQGLGKELFTKFAPPAFKDSFWRLKDKLGESFRTIQIYTNNPDLPWELMIPDRGVSGEDNQFLGTKFRISRWHTTDVGNLFERPPQSMLMKEIVVIAPEYAGNMALPGTKDEVKALQNILGYRRIAGSYDSVKVLANQLPDGIVHFAGHGILQPDHEGVFNYQIKLEDFDMDILTWRGLFQQNLNIHPVFFFNACDVGQSHQVGNFVDGWAPAVLETGASGYVGGLWPLNDKSAAEFAVTFYELLNGRMNSGAVNLADLLRDTRKHFYDDGDPTYLAYVYYGDPNLKIMKYSF